MTRQKLFFHDLSDRHFGVSTATGAAMAEAADVCLDRYHRSPTDFDIRDSGRNTVGIAEWNSPGERAKAANANLTDATEAGAYCIALAAIELTRGLVATGRAETLSGADYYLSEIGADLEDYEVARRLEVSGTDAGGEPVLNTRLNEKISQAANGKSNLPAIAMVVGFRARLVLSSDVETE